MTREVPRSSASISAEDWPLGPYLITLRGCDEALRAEETAFEHVIDLARAETLLVHLNNAVRGLRQRQTEDAVCGDCATCENVRMVDVPRKHGNGTERVHCPVCRPKIDAARARGITSDTMPLGGAR